MGLDQDFSAVQNRLTSTQASHPIEIGSEWSGREPLCFVGMKKEKLIL